MKYALVVLALAVVALASGVARAQFEPNDDFASRAILGPSVRQVSDSLLPSLAGAGPDTTLGAFDQVGTLLEFNDDNSPFGDGTASALYNIGINSDGSIHLKVSGYADCDFDGLDDYWSTAHPESGGLDLYVDVFNGSGSPVANLTFNDTLSAGAVISHDLTGYDAAGHYNAAIDNTPTTAEDPIDFMTFTSLPTGEVFHAEITAGGFDSMLGWFDDDGLLVKYDDDSGEGQFSKLYGEVPAGGNLHLAVTGHEDLLFEGDHAREGSYTLEVVTSPMGDANMDGTVDVLDLSVLANNFGGGDKVWEDADFNDDSVVDVLDLTVFANHFGEGGGSAGEAGQVPEPATMALVCMGAAAALAARGKSRRAGRTPPKAPRSRP